VSRIDEALRRARGDEADRDLPVDDLQAPWEFAEGVPTALAPAPPAPVEAEAEADDLAVRGSQDSDAPLTSASAPSGVLPDAGLFVSLDGDEKMVGAGLRQAVVEEYRKLSASLHQAQNEHGLQVLIVASAVPGEGKSLTAANVALTLTTSYSRRVLLIDADLRRPSLHSLFRAPVTSGLSEGLDAAIAARVTAIQLSSLLALLPAGRPVENPVPLLTSQRMAELIRDARQHFDWIVIDTPPVGLLTDANLLTKEADAALLVIHANRTPYPLVQKAIQAVGKAKIFGVVMNRLDANATVGANSYAGYGKYYKDYLQGPK
jgi:protein-tyrosine kinase